MKMTNIPPTEQGWYWVWYQGYEFPEVVLLNSQGKFYGCGWDREIEPKDILSYSVEKLVVPTNVY